MRSSCITAVAANYRSTAAQRVKRLS